MEIEPTRLISLSFFVRFSAQGIVIVYSQQNLGLVLVSGICSVRSYTPSGMHPLYHFASYAPIPNPDR